MVTLSASKGVPIGKQKLSVPRSPSKRKTILARIDFNLPNSMNRTKISDRFEDAREYYDFLENKRTVRFHPHPTRCDQEQYTPFDLVLNSKINYDTLSDRVATHLNAPSTHLRFWTVNATNNNPKAPVRRGTNPTLRQILNPMGTSTLNTSLRGDAFYFEVLDMSLAEFDTKKSIKLTWLSEGLTKEVRIPNT